MKTIDDSAVPDNVKWNLTALRYLLKCTREIVDGLIMGTPTGPTRDVFADINIELMLIKDKLGD